MSTHVHRYKKHTHQNERNDFFNRFILILTGLLYYYIKDVLDKQGLYLIASHAKQVTEALKKPSLIEVNVTLRIKAKIKIQKTGSAPCTRILFSLICVDKLWSIM